MSTQSVDASDRVRGISENSSASEPAPSPHLQAQQLLNRFYSRPRLAEHGRSDAATQEALQDFQHTRGLEPSGLPDQATLDELGRAIAWQAHEQAALAGPSGSEPESTPGPQLLGVPSGLASAPIPPHLSHLAPESLASVTLPSPRRMSNAQLQRAAGALSGLFDAEPEPKVRRQYARQLLRIEAELERRVATAPRDATELPVLRDVEWEAGSPNAGLVGDLHPFQNHDLWVSELEHGPQGIRRRARSEEATEPSTVERTTEAEGGDARQRVLDAARDVELDGLPEVPENELEQGVGTVAGGLVGVANVALGSAALVGGEALLLVSGTVSALRNAGDVREARGEIRGVMMALHFFDSRGRVGDSGRVDRQAMDRFIGRRYGQEVRADTVTGAGADGPRRVAAGRRKGIRRVVDRANAVLRKVDRAYARLSAEEQDAVDLEELREAALSALQHRSFSELAPVAREEGVAVD